MKRKSVYICKWCIPVILIIAITIDNDNDNDAEENDENNIDYPKNNSDTTANTNTIKTPTTHIKKTKTNESHKKIMIITNPASLPITRGRWWLEPWWWAWWWCCAADAGPRRIGWIFYVSHFDCKQERERRACVSSSCRFLFRMHNGCLHKH